MMCSAGAENRRQSNYPAVAIRQVSVKKAFDRTDGNHAAMLVLRPQEAVATSTHSSQGSDNMDAWRVISHSSLGSCLLYVWQTQLVACGTGMAANVNIITNT
jgi:hypothetical protein